MSKKKTIRVEVPMSIWERFYRLFPGQGERSAFLRKVIYKAIEVGEERESWLGKLVEEEMEEGEDGQI